MGKINIIFMPEYYKCNYKCPYCFLSGRAEEKNRWWNQQGNKLYTKIIDKLCLFPEIKRIRLGVMGEIFTSGLLIDGVLKLCMADNIEQLEILTNLSPSMEYLSNFIRKIDPNKLSVNATFHETQIKGGIREFIEKLNFLANKGVAISVNLVPIPGDFPNLIKNIEEFNKNLIPVGLIPFKGKLNGRYYPYSYTVGEIRELMSMSYSSWDIHRNIYAHKKHYFYYKKCYAGIRNIVLDGHGDYFPCHGTKSLPFRIKLGNILQEDEFNLIQKRYFICPVPICKCEQDHYMTEEFYDNFDSHRNSRVFKGKFTVSENLRPKSNSKLELTVEPNFPGLVEQVKALSLHIKGNFCRRFLPNRNILNRLEATLVSCQNGSQME